MLKNQKLPLLIISFLLLALFISCDKEGDSTIDPNGEEPVLLESVFTDTAYVMFRSIKGSDDGPVKVDDKSLLNVNLLDPSRLNVRIPQTTFSFIEGKDSVFVDGIYHVGSYDNRDYQRGIYSFALSSGKDKFQYKFENGKFMLKIPADKTLYDYEWFVVGYGNMEKFSIYIENKTIYSTHLMYTTRDFFTFIDPWYAESLNEFSEINYRERFFNHAKNWNTMNRFDPDFFPENYVGIGYVKRFDFELK